MPRYVALRFNIKLLQALGMWPSKGDTWYRGYSALIVCIYLAFFATVGLHVVYNWGSIDVVDSISVTLTNVTALTKLYMMLFSRQRIDALVAFIEEGLSVDHDVVEVKAKARVVATSIRRTRTLTIMYCSLFVWTAVVWAFSPFTIPAALFDHHNDDTDETVKGAQRVLPFRSWMPFDTQPSPNYEIAYTLQVVLSTVVALCIAATDTFYVALIIHTSSLFQILRLSVSHVTQQATAALTSLPPLRESRTRWGALTRPIVDERKAERMMRFFMVKHVKKHQAILKYCDDLEMFMSPIIFIEYLVVSFNLCLAGFQATVMPMYSIRFVTVLGYMVCVLLQLFFLCLYGSELLEESTQVMEAVYDCKWYGCSQDFKRSVLIMIMRASRPVKLTAGKFGTLTLETFNELIQTSYSYFAVLRKLHEERHAI